MFVDRLRSVREIRVSLELGRPVRNDNLVYLPMIGSTDSFDMLRDELLSTPTTVPRKHDPHLTLVHPRNGTCSESEFAMIESLCDPLSVTFSEVTVIEQIDGGPWRDLIVWSPLS